MDGWIGLRMHLLDQKSIYCLGERRENSGYLFSASLPMLYISYSPPFGTSGFLPIVMQKS